MKKCERIEVEITGAITQSDMVIIHLVLMQVNSRMSGKEGETINDLERQGHAIINKDYPIESYTGRMLKRKCLWLIVTVTGDLARLKYCHQLDHPQNKERI